MQTKNITRPWSVVKDEEKSSSSEPDDRVKQGARGLESFMLNQSPDSSSEENYAGLFLHTLKESSISMQEITVDLFLKSTELSAAS